MAFESCKQTQPERSYLPHLLELLEVVHALKALQPYLLDKPFELHTDNTSLKWLQQQQHATHRQALWLNQQDEYQCRVVHIPWRTNPADFSLASAFAVAPAQLAARATTILTQSSSSSRHPQPPLPLPLFIPP